MSIKEKVTPTTIALDLFVYSFIMIIVIATLFPVLHIVSVSLSENKSILAAQVSIFPRGFNIEAYKLIIIERTVPKAFLISVYITLLGTLINMALTVLMAYPISKKDLPYRKLLLVFLFIPMYIGGGMIPSFLLIKYLGLYNSFFALMLPGAVNVSYIIIMRTFFQSISSSIEDSARTDGASELRILLQIMIPLSKAAIASISLFFAVGHWNSWFSALIYLADSGKYPLQMILREVIMRNEVAKMLVMAGQIEAAQEYLDKSRLTVEGVKYSTLVISIVPMLIIYPFVQKHFVKGVMIGSLKE